MTVHHPFDRHFAAAVRQPREPGAPWRQRDPHALLRAIGILGPAPGPDAEQQQAPPVDHEADAEIFSTGLSAPGLAALAGRLERYAADAEAAAARPSVSKGSPASRWR